MPDLFAHLIEYIYAIFLFVVGVDFFECFSVLNTSLLDGVWVCRFVILCQLH